MKLVTCIAAFSLLAGSALAQQQSGSQAGSAQSGQQDQQSATQTKSDKTATSNQNQSASNGQPAEMKTRSYKGTLVAVGCGQTSAAMTGSGANGSSENAQGSAASGTSTSASTTAAAGSTNTSGATGSETNSANRSASDQSAGSCALSSSSSQLGLKMDDGRTLRFDLVGNQRAQDALQKNKKWSADATANKPVRVKVNGVISGDKLIVSSIH